MKAMTNMGVVPDSSYRALFQEGDVYLDTATYGLPPRVSLETMSAGLEAWGRGEPTPDDYDGMFNEARRLFASLVSTSPSDVALGSHTSVFVGLIASSLSPGSEVLLAEGDFTSLIFPFLIAERRGVRARFAPLEDLADHVRTSTDLVAVSAVQSSDGSVADMDTLSAAAAAADARVLLDTTQATGWWPFDASRFDYTVTSAYKWLLAPRGTAFLTATPEAREWLTPVAAGWYAGKDIWASIYGPPMRLAASARRFDVSPAWLAWQGAVPSLRLVQEIGPAVIGRHDVALANEFRAAVGLAAGNSPIVAVDVEVGMAGAIARRGIRASMRGGRLRLSFHLYNTSQDVEHVLAALLRSREGIGT